MNEFTIALLVIAVIAIIIMYNMIISRMNRARRAWADVIAYEKLKGGVIPQLMSLTEQFKEFEASFISKVTSMRESLASANEHEINHAQLEQIEAHSKAVFSQLKATAENYPELGSAKIVQDLIHQIADKNENVAAAITIYNRGVEQFNNSIEMVPLNLVNALLARKQKLATFHQSGTVESYDYKPNFS